MFEFSQSSKGKKIIETNERVEKDEGEYGVVSFLFFIYKQRRKLKRSLSFFHPPRKERSCIRYESLRFSPLFGPPYKSAHSTAINNQLFTRFCPQTLFNVSYSTPGGLRDPAGWRWTWPHHPYLEWESLEYTRKEHEWDERIVKKSFIEWENRGGEREREKKRDSKYRDK